MLFSETKNSHERYNWRENERTNDREMTVRVTR